MYAPLTAARQRCMSYIGNEYILSPPSNDLRTMTRDSLTLERDST